MKGQSALEFVTTYGWAFLAIMLVVVATYYFISLKPVNPSCDFGPTASCSSYQFFKKTDGTMRLRMTMANGMGRAISFWVPDPSGSGYILLNQTLTVSNIGKSGVNNYNGNCTGPAIFVKNGDMISCSFDIPDTNAVPDVGKFAKFDLSIHYIACETDPLYPARCNGDNRTLHGSIVTPFEAGLNYSSYCMDEVCDAGENYTNCPWDCEPPYPKSLTVTSTANCSWSDRLYKDNESDQVNVTVYDQYSKPLPGVQVKIYPEDMPAFPGVVQHITAYIVNPPTAVTDSNGHATATFTWHACNCCFPSSICGFPVFRYAAVSGQAYGHDTSCAVLDGSSFDGMQCCPT
jgi:hypothetical protein